MATQSSFNPPFHKPTPANDPAQTDFQYGEIPLNTSGACREAGLTRTFTQSEQGDMPGPPDRCTKENTINVGEPLFARYIIKEEIGRGGVGVVYKAWDIELHREIAVKLIFPAQFAKPLCLRRFLEEARIASRLHHPGIVSVHDMGVSPDGRPFFVMSLVRGKTFDQMVGRRDGSSTDLAQLLVVFLQICQAVAYAHSEGVIHRDLKPANIMVGSFGVVKVMDWGLAKELGEQRDWKVFAAAKVKQLRDATAKFDPDSVDTQFGTAFGTPAYLPPEQARGEIDNVDKRADVFGLGAILCEILTGRPPYTGADGHEVYCKALAADLSDAILRVNSCPIALDLASLTRWCLSPDAADRPEDASVVVEVMNAYLHGAQRRAEQALLQFFDLSMDLFCIASTDGYFLRVNENFPRTLGYTTSELLSRPFLDFVHPEDRRRTENETNRIANGALSIQFTNRYRHADGHYLWLEWNAQPVHEERAIYAVARDVTKRIANEEAHRRAEQLREHLAAVVDSADVAIISISLSAVIQSWNNGAERLFGYQAKEVIGRSIDILSPPDRIEETAEVLSRLIRSNQVEHYETIRRRANGTLVPISATISPVKDEAGNVIGASKIARDISDRKAPEHARLKSEARLRAVVDHAVDGIVTIDSKGIIESVNHAAAQMFGYSATELKGSNVRILMPPPYRQQHDGYLADYLLTGLAKVIGKTQELTGQRKDGVVFPLELSVSEIRDADYRIFTGVLRDITSRKKLEGEVSEQLRVAEFIAATGVALTRGEGLGKSLNEFVEMAVAHLNVAFARVWTLNEPEGVLELQASGGMYKHLDGPHSRIPVGKYNIGQIAQERRPLLTNSVIGDFRVNDQAWAIREGMVAFAGHPLMIGERVAGVMAVFARQPLSANILATLRSVADSLALAIRRQQLEDEVQKLQERAATGNRQ